MDSAATMASREIDNKVYIRHGFEGKKDRFAIYMPIEAWARLGLERGDHVNVAWFGGSNNQVKITKVMEGATGARMLRLQGEHALAVEWKGVRARRIFEREDTRAQAQFDVKSAGREGDIGVITFDRSLPKKLRLANRPRRVVMPTIVKSVAPEQLVPTPAVESLFVTQGVAGPAVVQPVASRPQGLFEHMDDDALEAVIGQRMVELQVLLSERNARRVSI